MYKHGIKIGLGLVFLAIIIPLCCFKLPEGKQAVVKQFGEIIPPAKTEAGLKLILPWRDVDILEKRLLEWDGIPNQIPTKDKKYIIVDTTARWKIVDPIKFIQNLVSLSRARPKIKNWIDSATREVISSHNLVETVRNTNEILKVVREHAEARKKAQLENQDNSNTLEILEEEPSGEILEIREGREHLSAKIVERARPEMEANGLALIDVQLRRIAYEESVEKKVYERMITERQRIASKLRSIGKGEQAKINGKKERELQQIQSQAYRKVQTIKGAAQSEAIAIYAEAVGKDQEFYEFLRTIEMYKEGLRSDAKLILSSEAAFMKFLKDGPHAKRYIKGQ